MRSLHDDLWDTMYPQWNREIRYFYNRKYEDDHFDSVESRLYKKYASDILDNISEKIEDRLQDDIQKIKKNQLVVLEQLCK